MVLQLGRCAVFLVKRLREPRKVLRSRKHYTFNCHYDVARVLDSSGDRWNYYHASPYKLVEIFLDGQTEDVGWSTVAQSLTPRGRTLFCVEEVTEEAVAQARQRSFVAGQERVEWLSNRSQRVLG